MISGESGERVTSGEDAKCLDRMSMSVRAIRRKAQVRMRVVSMVGPRGFVGLGQEERWEASCPTCHHGNLMAKISLCWYSKRLRRWRENTRITKTGPLRKV